MRFSWATSYGNQGGWFCRQIFDDGGLLDCDFDGRFGVQFGQRYWQTNPLFCWIDWQNFTKGTCFGLGMVVLDETHLGSIVGPLDALSFGRYRDLVGGMCCWKLEIVALFLVRSSFSNHRFFSGQQYCWWLDLFVLLPKLIPTSPFDVLFESFAYNHSYCSRLE